MDWQIIITLAGIHGDAVAVEAINTQTGERRSRTLPSHLVAFVLLNGSAGRLASVAGLRRDYLGRPWAGAQHIPPDHQAQTEDAQGRLTFDCHSDDLPAALAHFMGDLPLAMLRDALAFYSTIAGEIDDFTVHEVEYHALLASLMAWIIRHPSIRTSVTSSAVENANTPVSVDDPEDGRPTLTDIPDHGLTRAAFQAPSFTLRVPGRTSKG